MMVLIDTSSWIHFLRTNGDTATRNRVDSALQTGDARICPIVSLELWNGARGERERKVLEEIMRAVPQLAIDQGVWQDSYALAKRARSSGLTIPASDVLIAACAKYHGAILETADSDFDQLQQIISQRTH